jgi:hypothetical protein
MLKAMSTYVYVKERLHPDYWMGWSRAARWLRNRAACDYANRRQHVRGMWIVPHQ